MGCILPCKHNRLRSKWLAKLGANFQRVSKSDGYHIYTANIHILTAYYEHYALLIWEVVCIVAYAPACYRNVLAASSGKYRYNKVYKEWVK